jgi:hypothetical protein
VCGNRQVVLISGLPYARLQTTSQKTLILRVQMMYQLHRIAAENYFLPTSHFYGETEEISGTFSVEYIYLKEGKGKGVP